MIKLTNNIGAQWLTLIAVSIFCSILLWTQFPPDLRPPAFTDIELRLGPPEVARAASTPGGQWHQGFLLRTEGPWEEAADGSGGITPEGGTVEAGFQMATPGAPWAAARLRIEGSPGAIWSARIRRDFESQFIPRIEPGEWAEFGGEVFPGFEAGSEAPLQLFLFPARGEGDPPPGTLTGLRFELEASPQEPLAPGYPGVLVGGFLPLALGLFLRYVGGRDRPRAPAFGVLIGGIAVLTAAFHEPAWLQYLWAATTAFFLGAGANAALHATLNPKGSTRWADPEERKVMATWSLMAGLICVALWMRWEVFEAMRGAAGTSPLGSPWPDGVLAPLGIWLGEAISAGGEASPAVAARFAGLWLSALMVGGFFAAGWVVLGRRGGLLMAALAAASPLAVEGLRMDPGLVALAMAGLPLLLAGAWLGRGRLAMTGRNLLPLVLLGLSLLLFGIPVLAMLVVLGAMMMLYRFTGGIPVLPTSLAGVALVLISTLSLPQSLNAPMARALVELPKAVFGEQWFLGLLVLGVLPLGWSRLQRMRTQPPEGGCRSTFNLLAVTAMGMAMLAATGWQLASMPPAGGHAATATALTAFLFPFVALAWAAGTLTLADVMRNYTRRQLKAAGENMKQLPPASG